MIIEDGIPQPAEVLVGNMPFGFTLQQIQEVAENARNEIRKIDIKLSEANVLEGLREALEGMKKREERILAAPPEEILTNFREIYDFIIQQEQDGLKRDEIVKKVKNEAPKLLKIIQTYPFIEKQVWGYHLHQLLFALSLSQ